LHQHTLTHDFFSFFVFNNPTTPEIYTLSLHDALPILHRAKRQLRVGEDRRAEDHALGACLKRLLDREVRPQPAAELDGELQLAGDRKSTRLNSSHVAISYAVFCLKKKKNNEK